MTAYSASLWTDATTWSMQSPFALSLSYNMAFSHQDVVARSLKEMKSINPSVSDDTLANYGAIMSRVFPDVKSGDEITGLYQPGGSVRFFYNGRATVEVHDPAFARAFFGIWLSPQTSDTKLRKQLLRA